MSQTLINVSAAKAEALSEFLGAINNAAAKKPLPTGLMTSSCRSFTLRLNIRR